MAKIVHESLIIEPKFYVTAIKISYLRYQDIV